MRAVIARRSPATADRAATLGAAGLAASVRSSSRLASSAGISERLARDWLTGSSRSVITRFFHVLASLAVTEGATPFPLVAAARVVALESLMVGMTDVQLIGRFWQLMEAETAAESTENRLQVMLSAGVDLDELADAATKEAALDEELAAVARELKKRGLDPRRPRLM